MAGQLGTLSNIAVRIEDPQEGSFFAVRVFDQSGRIAPGEIQGVTDRNWTINIPLTINQYGGSLPTLRQAGIMFEVTRTGSYFIPQSSGREGEAAAQRQVANFQGDPNTEFGQSEKIMYFDSNTPRGNYGLYGARYSDGRRVQGRYVGHGGTYTDYSHTGVILVFNDEPGVGPPAGSSIVTPPRQFSDLAPETQSLINNLRSGDSGVLPASPSSATGSAPGTNQGSQEPGDNNQYYIINDRDKEMLDFIASVESNGRYDSIYPGDTSRPQILQFSINRLLGYQNGDTGSLASLPADGSLPVRAIGEPGRLQIYRQTRAVHSPDTGLNISMDFNASSSGTATGTEVIIPDNASPELRQAAQRYNTLVAEFAARNGYSNYPIRGVRTTSENGRGVRNTVHTEPFFNNDIRMQEIIQENPAEFAQIYVQAFGDIDARLIPPHGSGRDRGASSRIFRDETTFGEIMVDNLYESAEQAASLPSGGEQLENDPAADTEADDAERALNYSRASAAGRYQLIPEQINRAAEYLGLNKDLVRFSREVQDAMCMEIIKRDCNYTEWTRGTLLTEEFQFALSGQFEGIPLPCGASATAQDQVINGRLPFDPEADLEGTDAEDPVEPTAGPDDGSRGDDDTTDEPENGGSI